jgi:hypothetical protein
MHLQTSALVRTAMEIAISAGAGSQRLQRRPVRNGKLTRSLVWINQDNAVTPAAA